MEGLPHLEDQEKFCVMGMGEKLSSKSGGSEEGLNSEVPHGYTGEFRFISKDSGSFPTRW